ncbi:type II secretion system protein N [Phenylobacterium sp.]|uniref:type II secretion system protein N n=1 Tax=Phenylobacterium sp. TaxID=1871053 RepID=UPI00391C0393
MKLQLQALGVVRPRRLLTAVEIALAAGLAVQAARLTWTLVTPLGPVGKALATAPVRPPAADLSILAQFDPFFRLPAAAPAGAAQSSGGGFVLYGVRVQPGGRGSAILAASGGPQRFYDVGQEVEPGLILASVAADHVVLNRGGARLRVGFPRPTPGTVVLPMETLAPAPAASGPGPAVNLDRLLDQATLLPRMREGRPSGYQVVPRGGDDLLRAAGLQRGDVLLSVDGVVLTPERVSQLRQDLSEATGAEIRFERNGQVMTTNIRMAQ